MLTDSTPMCVTTGFDGFVDSILRVKRSEDGGQTPYFETIKEFGQYVAGKAGKSGSLETELQQSKLGGNMPNFASCLAALGVSVNCIGAMGWPELNPAFKPLEKKARLFSVCNPGRCDSLEFTDGKLMLAENGEIGTLDYALLAQRLDGDVLEKLFASAHLLALLNWSEMRQATSLWRGVLALLLSRPGADRSMPVFMDFSDCSARTAEEVAEVAALVAEFGRHFKVILSLNQNEVEQMAAKLGLPGEPKEATAALFDTFCCQALIIHLTNGCYFRSGEDEGFIPNQVVEAPAILTGGGDNFNAGFVFAHLSGLGIRQALGVANAVSGYYVVTGHSPSRAELKEWMKQNEYFEEKTVSEAAQTIAQGHT